MRSQRPGPRSCRQEKGRQRSGQPLLMAESARREKQEGRPRPEPEPGLSQRKAPVGNLGKPLQRGENPPQKAVEGAAQRCGPSAQKAENPAQHQKGKEGHQDQVGQRRQHRHASRPKEKHRQTAEVGRQSPAQQPDAAFHSGEPLDPPGNPGGHRRRPPGRNGKQCRRSQHRQPEAAPADHPGIPQTEQEHRAAQGVPRGVVLDEGPGGQRKRRHDPRPDRGGRGSGEDHIGPAGEEGQEKGRLSRAQNPPEHPLDPGHEHGNVKPGNAEQMGRSGGGKPLPDPVGQRVGVPQEHRLIKGRRVRREIAVEPPAQIFLQTAHPGDGAGSRAFQRDGLRRSVADQVRTPAQLIPGGRSGVDLRRQGDALPRRKLRGRAGVDQHPGSRGKPLLRPNQIAGPGPLGHRFDFSGKGNRLPGPLRRPADQGAAVQKGRGQRGGDSQKDHRSPPAHRTPEQRPRRRPDAEGPGSQAESGQDGVSAEGRRQQSAGKDGSRQRQGLQNRPGAHSSARFSRATRTASTTKAEKVQSLPRMASSTWEMTSLGNRMDLLVVGGTAGILNLRMISLRSLSILWDFPACICMTIALRLRI